jgi:hypothetical protein
VSVSQSYFLKKRFQISLVGVNLYLPLMGFCIHSTNCYQLLLCGFRTVSKTNMVSPTVICMFVSAPKFTC